MTKLIVNIRSPKIYTSPYIKLQRQLYVKPNRRLSWLHKTKWSALADEYHSDVKSLESRYQPCSGTKNLVRYVAS